MFPATSQVRAKGVAYGFIFNLCTCRVTRIIPVSPLRRSSGTAGFVSQVNKHRSYENAGNNAQAFMLTI